MAAKTISRNKNIPASQNTSGGLYLLILGILLAIGTWFAFEPGIKNNFVDWDDLKYITENGCIQLKGKDLVNNIFFGECKYVMGNYHPLTILSYAWNFQSGKFNPEVYHKTNVVIHILNTLLLLVLVYKLTKGKLFAAGFAAALFALHPMHVESVIWAAERKDVLYTLFLLLAWLAWLYLEKSGTGLRTTVVSVLFILSCLSKGMAVVLPLLLLLCVWVNDKNIYDFLRNNSVSKWLSADNLKQILNDPRAREFAVYFAISLFFGYMAVHSQDTQGGIRNYPQFNVLHRILLAIYGFMHYLWKTVYPTGFSAIYPYPILEGSMMPSKYYIAPIGFLILLAALIFSLRKSPYFAFALVGYGICILPVLQILPVGEAIAADRYFYVSSIPLFIGLGWLIESYFLKEKPYILYAASGITLVIVAVLFIFTRDQVMVWNNDLSLFSNAVLHEPTASQAHNNIGIYHQRAKDLDKALPFYEEAIRLNDKYARAYSNMGACYYDLKRYQESVGIYHKAIQSDPTFADAWYNLGNSWYMLGKYNVARKFYSHAIELNPYYYAAFYNRAVCKGIQGEHADALEDYKTAARGGHAQAQDALRRSNINWNDKAPVPNMQGQRP